MKSSLHTIGTGLVLSLLFAAGLVAQTDSRRQHRSLPAPETHPLEQPDEPFDVLHYDARIDLTRAPEPVIDATVDIVVLWEEAPDGRPFIFHLRSLEIASVAVDGEPAVADESGLPEEADYHYEVAMPPSVAAGDTTVVRVSYFGRMTSELGNGSWGGVSSSDGVLYALGVGFLNNYVSTTQHWLACYDHPFDKATFSGAFTVADSMVAVSNGTNDSTLFGSVHATYFWHERHPCATYLLTFAVGDYEEISFSDTGVSTPMMVWTLPEDRFGTTETFSDLPRMVKTYEAAFVPYPFDKVGYVNTPQGAMEHQTLVSFPRSIAIRGNPVNSIGAHELAHQWFGDLVTPVDFRHAWLNESFATWCETLWQEELNGFDGYLSAVEEDLDSYLRFILPREGDLPLYDFSREPPSSNYPATIYDKGSVVVGLLRFELGDSLFFRTLRTYLDRYAYGNVETTSFQEVAEEVSGRDLDWFFRQWVFRAATPVVELTVSNDRPADTLTVECIQSSAVPDTPFVNLPIELSLFMSDTVVHRLVRLDSIEQTFSIPTDGRVYDVLVNRGPSVRTLAQFTVDKLLSVDSDESFGSSFECLDVHTSSVGGRPTVVVDFCSDDTGLRPLVRNHNVRAYVYSIGGSRVSTYHVDSIPTRLGLPDVPPGSYFLLLEFGNRRVSTRFQVF